MEKKKEVGWWAGAVAVEVGRRYDVHHLRDGSSYELWSDSKLVLPASSKAKAEDVDGDEDDQKGKGKTRTMVQVMPEARMRLLVIGEGSGRGSTKIPSKLLDLSEEQLSELFGDKGVRLSTVMEWFQHQRGAESAAAASGKKKSDTCTLWFNRHYHHNVAVTVAKPRYVPLAHAQPGAYVYDWGVGGFVPLSKNSDLKNQAGVKLASAGSGKNEPELWVCCPEEIWEGPVSLKDLRQQVLGENKEWLADYDAAHAAMQACVASHHVGDWMSHLQKSVRFGEPWWQVVFKRVPSRGILILAFLLLCAAPRRFSPQLHRVQRGVEQALRRTTIVIYEDAYVPSDQHRVLLQMFVCALLCAVDPDYYPSASVLRRFVQVAVQASAQMLVFAWSSKNDEKNRKVPTDWNDPLSAAAGLWTRVMGGMPGDGVMLRDIAARKGVPAPLYSGHDGHGIDVKKHMEAKTIPSVYWSVDQHSRPEFAWLLDPAVVLPLVTGPLDRPFAPVFRHFFQQHSGHNPRRPPPFKNPDEPFVRAGRSAQLRTWRSGPGKEPNSAAPVLNEPLLPCDQQDEDVEEDQHENEDKADAVRVPDDWASASVGTVIKGNVQACFAATSLVDPPLVMRKFASKRSLASASASAKKQCKKQKVETKHETVEEKEHAYAQLSEAEKTKGFNALLARATAKTGIAWNSSLAPCQEWKDAPPHIRYVPDSKILDRPGQILHGHWEIRKDKRWLKWETGSRLDTLLPFSLGSLAKQLCAYTREKYDKYPAELQKLQHRAVQLARQWTSVLKWPKISREGGAGGLGSGGASSNARIPMLVDLYAHDFFLHFPRELVVCHAPGVMETPQPLLVQKVVQLWSELVRRSNGGLVERKKLSVSEAKAQLGWPEVYRRDDKGRRVPRNAFQEQYVQNRLHNDAPYDLIWRTVGGGKTGAALESAYLTLLDGRWRSSLIIWLTPKHAIGSARSEFKKYGLDSCILVPETKTQVRAAHTIVRLADAPKGCVVLVAHDTVRKVLDLLSEAFFGAEPPLLVVDEVHKLNDASTQRCSSISHLMSAAERCIALTGTAVCSEDMALLCSVLQNMTPFEVTPATVLPACSRAVVATDELAIPARYVETVIPLSDAERQRLKQHTSAVLGGIKDGADLNAEDHRVLQEIMANARERELARLAAEYAADAKNGGVLVEADHSPHAKVLVGLIRGALRERKLDCKVARVGRAGPGDAVGEVLESPDLTDENKDTVHPDLRVLVVPRRMAESFNVQRCNVAINVVQGGALFVLTQFRGRVRRHGQTRTVVFHQLRDALGLDNKAYLRSAIGHDRVAVLTQGLTTASTPIVIDD